MQSAISPSNYFNFSRLIKSYVIQQLTLKSSIVLLNITSRTIKGQNICRFWILSRKRTKRIILTDLDGSLLDHDTYSFGPANLPVMLEKIGIPVIPVTSKTFSEVLKLKNELNNNHPFITENGSAIYIPKSYFKTTKLNWKIRNDHF